MKFEEINRKYTVAIAEWLAKGYIINTATMSGSQGELAHIDLTNGQEIIRVVLASFGHPVVKLNDNYYCFDGIELIIGRVTDHVTPNSPDTWQTVWNQHLEVISREEWYVIGQRYDSHKRFYGTKEQSIAQQDKNRERDRARRTATRVELDEAAKAIILPFIRRQPKCKSVKLNEISNVTKEYRYHTEGGHFRAYARYTVVARGQSYTLK